VCTVLPGRLCIKTSLQWTRKVRSSVFDTFFSVAYSYASSENVTPDKQKDFNKEDINQLVNFHHKYAPKAADGSLLVLLALTPPHILSHIYTSSIV